MRQEWDDYNKTHGNGYKTNSHALPCAHFLALTHLRDG